MPCTTALRAGRRARLSVGRCRSGLLTTIYFAGAGRPRCAVSAVAGLVWPRSGQRQPRLLVVAGPGRRGRARRARERAEPRARAARSGRESRARARRGAGRGPRARRGHSGQRRLCLCGHSASGSRAKNHTNQYNPPYYKRCEQDFIAQAWPPASLPVVRSCSRSAEDMPGMPAARCASSVRCRCSSEVCKRSRRATTAAAALGGAAAAAATAVAGGEEEELLDCGSCRGPVAWRLAGGSTEGCRKRSTVGTLVCLLIGGGRNLPST